MLLLYLTRHGQTEWNAQQRMQGWKDSTLTTAGVANALLLGKRLADTHIDVVYSSTSRRASDTAKLICKGRPIQINLDDNLREINFGDWEGETKEDIQKKCPQQYDAFWNNPNQYDPTLHHAESFVQLRNRVKHALQRILIENISGRVLVVSHAVTIKTIIALCKELPIGQLWHPPTITDTSLTIIEYANRRFNVLLEGDTSHKLDIQETPT